MPRGLDFWAPVTALAVAFSAQWLYRDENVPPPSPLSNDGGLSANPLTENPDVPVALTEEPQTFAEEPQEVQNSTDILECDRCGFDVPRESAVKCPGCTALYCGQSCLEKSADHHVRYCANPLRPLTTADNMVTAAFDDMFPDDLQTNEDYFFTRTQNPQDRTKLLGLYIGILKFHEVKPSTLHAWRLTGTMVENIKALYEPLPVANRGGYYPWFLKHLDIFEPSAPNALVALSPRHICASCGVSATVRCSGCKKVWYCRKKCQEDHWGSHLVDCNPGRPITSADHLRAAVHRRKLPEDLDILSDYGFTRVNEVGGKILLNVYQIIFEDGVRSRDIHQWKTSGHLLQEVEKVLRRLENWKTYPVLPWFEEHRYAFDQDAAVDRPGTESDDQIGRIMEAQVELWNKVGDFPSQNWEEIRSTINNEWSDDRATFFLFRSMLGIYHPGPDLHFWVNFGFSACHDEAEESFLALTYQILAGRCSYNEFSTAYCNSTLIQLIDDKGLRGRRLTHPYLEDVLSGSPTVFKSAWPLKQYVQLPGKVQSDITPSVQVDYGFMNCTSDSEYQDLKDLYKNIFERPHANPLQLHEACISGSLYEYVLGLFPEMKKKKNRKKKFQRLLRNLYPLQDL
ncbi:hypothetical protein K438DRAFT_1874218 [Mycena galopus ATCC 62051]|nr:hypothetical protein K438DRAFT_1874218 [Mycena galopus ATCC 62051]